MVQPMATYGITYDTTIVHPMATYGTTYCTTSNIFEYILSNRFY